MDYLDAIQCTFTLNEVLSELADHYITGSELDAFFKDVGLHQTYTGEAVLNWLGY